MISNPEQDSQSFQNENLPESEAEEEQLDPFSGDGNLSRLRQYYFEKELETAGGKNSQNESSDFEIPSYLVTKAYELPDDEAVDPVGLYLKELSAVSLLNMDQEVDLAKKIEAAKKAHQKRNQSREKIPAREKKEIDNLIEIGLLAKDHLIKANTRLVVSIAKKYIGRGVLFLDLIQEGNLGVMIAVDKFDYRRGFRFSTHATWWIRQTITRAIASQGRTIRIPNHMIDRISQFYKTVHLLEQRIGHPPSIEELAKEMDKDRKEIEKIIRFSWFPLSLDSPVGDEKDAELGAFVEDVESPSPSQIADSNMEKEKLNKFLDTLTPKEAQILRLRYGLKNGRSHTLEEVGKKFGVTRERIRQIEGKALRRMRYLSES